MSDSINKKRQWIDKQSNRRLYCEKDSYLRTCVLCGNRYPFTPRWFESGFVDYRNLHGLIYEGLLQVCLICKEHWGETYKDDVNRIYGEALDNDAAGQQRPIKPLARRK